MLLGNGFVGSEIANQLQAKGIPYIATSKSGSDGDVALDLCSPNAVEQVRQLAKGCTAVISTVGTINEPDDYESNASNKNAAIGAKQAGVPRFVFIGNEPRVRDFTKQFQPLQNYAKGKEEAEAMIRQQFPTTSKSTSHVIIQPNFIYGGQDFGLAPPRVPSTFGQIMEDVLGLYPFQAAAEALPGVLGIAMEAPVSRERVAAAAINAAIGLLDRPEDAELSSRDDIIYAASKRMPPKVSNERNVRVLKKRIYELGDCGGDPEKLREAFDLLEQIESLRTRKPAQDPGLLGRWEFVFDVEADIGTGVIKNILEGNSPVKPIFDLKDLCLKIFEDEEGGTKINILVSTKVLSAVPVELVIKTSIVPEERDPTGTKFVERFEGMRLAGVPVPIPEDWRRGRPLEFSYLDDTMLIARGNGGEPHYLRREAENCDVDIENCYL